MSFSTSNKKILYDKIYSTATVRQIEKEAIRGEASIEFSLMQKAGRFAFETLMSHFNNISGLTVFCGKGNNGGDGYIVAALSQKKNIPTICVELYPKPKTSVSQKAKNFALEQAVTFVSFEDWVKYLESHQADSFEENNSAKIPTQKYFFHLKNSIVVDAILGIGIKGNLGELEDKVISHINHFSSLFSRHVLAIDIPSGLSADTGELTPTPKGERNAVIAQATATFVGLKKGLFLSASQKKNQKNINHVGKIFFSNLEISPHHYEDKTHLYETLLPNKIVDFFPKRLVYHSNSHKGTFGHLLIVGGNIGMEGAVVLAAQSAFAMGVGKVTVLTRSVEKYSFLARCPEVMVISNLKPSQILEMTKDKTGLVLGPGLGRDDWGKKMYKLLFNLPIKKIVDADALRLLAKDFFLQADLQTDLRLSSLEEKDLNLELIQNLKNTILTPHPGEASNLLNCLSSQIQKNQDTRESAVLTLRKKYLGTVILKGENTLVANVANVANSEGDEENIFFCPWGNPGLATAGTGDVLAGIIGSLLAQGHSIEESSKVGVTLHACLGDLIIEKEAEESLTAQKLIHQIGDYFKNLKR